MTIAREKYVASTLHTLVGKGKLWFSYLAGKEYRIATYLGAKPVRITPSEIIVRQGKYSLIVKPEVSYGHPLRAPVGGAMHRTIYEHPACKIYYHFEENRKTLLELDAPNAAFEYEY